jgi:hypothetical protein
MDENIPVKTIQRTRVGKDIIVVNTIVKVGYGPCKSGSIGIGSISIGGSKQCSIYDARTRLFFWLKM